MALRINKTWTHENQRIKSGEFCTFRYRAYKNDPNPHCIFINYITGINPSTDHQWRLIQCINLSYVPRKDRQRFVKDWWETYEKNDGNVEFTWKIVKASYPYISFAIRRYMTKPIYYISDFKVLRTRKQIGDVIVGNWAKDFSKFLKRKIASTFRRFF